VKAIAPTPTPYPIGVQRRLTWISVLDAPGALGQVVVNGTQVSYPGFGRSHGVADLSSSRLPGQSEIRVEAQVVAADGPGTWEFSFRTHEGRGVIQPGSLRVIAGEVVALTQDGVVFRVKGQPGERLVFGAASR
jgi:hypothetical protein